MANARRERHRARVEAGIIIPISRQRELAAAANPPPEEGEDTEDEAVNFLLSMSGGDELRVTRQMQAKPAEEKEASPPRPVREEKEARPPRPVREAMKTRGRAK